jgi:hypothetical protein
MSETIINFQVARPMTAAHACDLWQKSQAATLTSPLFISVCVMFKGAKRSCTVSEMVNNTMI